MSVRRRPRDLHARGFAYDPIVVGIVGHHLHLLEASALVDDPALDAELAALDAVLAARRGGIHRRVEWATHQRDVCTCGLVLDRQGFADPVGHVDAADHALAGTIVVQDGDGQRGACQHCGAFYVEADLDRLRRWQRTHVCPPDPVEPPEFEVPKLDFEVFRTSEEYFHRVLVARQRLLHPRSDGGSE